MDEITIPEHHSLVWFRADDGFLVSALLVTEEYERMEDILDIPIVLQVHGLLGNFLSRGTPRLLPHALLEHGYSSLSINTRLAFAGQMTTTGVFDDTIKDVDAGIQFLTAEGFSNIFILGYSLGAAMLAHWAANRKHPNVRGLIFEGFHYSLPDSKRTLYEKWGSAPAYDEIYRQAKDILGDDPYSSINDETFVVYQCTGPTKKPLHDEIYTYKSWWFMIGPDAYNAMAHRQAGKIKLPSLIIKGEHDFLVNAWEPEALAKIARDAGNEHVRVREIPGARHECMENADAMLKEIVDLISTYSSS